MNLSTITAWIKNNLLMALVIGLVAAFMFFPKMFKGLFGTTRRRRRRLATTGRSYGRPRSRRPGVSRKRVSRVRTISRLRRPATRRRKGAKKPWQIKGSRAAKLRMARIRRMR